MNQNVIDFLASLQQRGVRIWVDNGTLRFQAPRGALLPAELAMLRELRSSLLKLLEARQLFAEGITRRPSGCTAPLAAVQRHFMLTTLCKLNNVYRRSITVAARLIGPMDRVLLQNCIEFVISRHESLRTRIVTKDRELLQSIDESCHLCFEDFDLRMADPREAEASIRSIARQQVELPIDLLRESLFKAMLFSVTDYDHVLVLAMNHLITDGISKAIVSQEIWTLYEQGARGLPLSLPPQVLQFPDYSVWQQRMFPIWLEQHAEYWKRHLSNSTPVEIPCMGTSGKTENPTGAVYQAVIGESLSIKLRDLAHRHRTLLSLIVLTLYLIEMSRWCNNRDLVVMFVLSGRDRPELAGMTGFLVNAVYLRVELASHESFIDLLRRVTAEFHAAYEHQDVGVEFLSECVTDLGFNWRPNYQPHWSGDRRQSDKEIAVEPFSFRASLPVKFTPMFSETDAGIGVTILYRSDLFPDQIVRQFVQNLRCLAEEYAEHPLNQVRFVTSKETDPHAAAIQ